MDEDVDDTQVIEIIMEAIGEWFGDKKLDPDEVEDCAGQISGTLNDAGLLNLDVRGSSR